jgi:hypothetical protein
VIPVVALVTVAERPSAGDHPGAPVLPLPVPALPLVPLLLVLSAVLAVTAATGLFSPRAGTPARMRARLPGPDGRTGPPPPPSPIPPEHRR